MTTEIVPLSMSTMSTPEFLRDPYPFYARLLNEAPVHYEPEWGSWHLSRYADCQAAFRNPYFSSQRVDNPDDVPPPDWLPDALREQATRIFGIDRTTLIAIDPPKHTRIRSLVSKAFTPRVIDSLRARIEALVSEFLDAAIEARTDTIDLVSALAYPLPATVIAEMMGVPVQDRDRFRTWANAAAATLDLFALPEDMRVSAIEGSIALYDYLDGLIRDRQARSDAGSDLIGTLVTASINQERLSAQELVGNTALLLVAGHETTTNLIGSSILALLRHPDQMTLLRTHPEFIDNAVEEFLRFDPPVQMDSRRATRDLTIGAHTIQAGQWVNIVIAAANRDPLQFADPHRLDIRRTDNRHLSFAHGIHFCLGAPLARLEAQIAIAAILRRFEHIALATDNLTWRPNRVLRGLATLPLTVR